MRQNINRSSKPSLMKQIQIFKNYSAHRQRINESRYRSISPLKKTMSFDKQKLRLHDYIKQRRQYTSDFKRRQALKKSENNDAKMLQKIMEYENKNFVFSHGPGSISNNLLHHNAIISSYRKTEKIDQQNEQIHFRITRAKSLYNHRPTHNKLVFTNNYSHLISNNLHFKDQDLKKCRVLTQGQEIHCDDIDEDVKNFTNYSEMENSRGLPFSKEKLNPQNENLSQPNSNCFQKSKIWNINFKGELTHKKIQNRVCDRIRREKLAQKLYQKKRNIFNSMALKLKIKS